MTAADERVFVIAEAGVNHNGSVQRARELIDIAAEAGADAVKFQTFSAKELVTAAAPKAAYQVRNTGEDGAQRAMLEALELGEGAHRELKAHCDKAGIEFMSSVFGPYAVDFLASLGVQRLKIPSGELINGPMMLKAARTGLPLIVSTGMASAAEVFECLDTVLWGRRNATGMPVSRAALRLPEGDPTRYAALAADVWLMQCVTQYPAPVEATNLRAMDYLRDATGLPAGLSDHSLGWHVALAAAARGACVIEKHFTLSRALPGPDHAASLEPNELARMVREIRDIEAALGAYGKTPNGSEIANRVPARGSLVAAAAIAKGEPFGPANLTVKRPGTGVTPFAYWDYVAGRRAGRDYRADEPIEE